MKVNASIFHTTSNRYSKGKKASQRNHYLHLQTTYVILVYITGIWNAGT